MTIEDIARICHEANRAYCDTGGDSSQRPWHEAEPAQRESAIKGVRFALANPNATPAQQHEAWLQDKLVAGWTWGPVKDWARKEHPCIKPYEALPEFQRGKDSLFQGIVKALGPFLEVGTASVPQ